MFFSFFYFYAGQHLYMWLIFLPVNKFIFLYVTTNFESLTNIGNCWIGDHGIWKCAFYFINLLWPMMMKNKD